MRVFIFNDYEQVSRAAAELFVEVLQKKPNAVLGLATGSTPLGLYKELIRRHREEKLSFANATTFNLDEYIGLEPTNAQSYRRFMQENLFDHIDVKSEKTNVPLGNVPSYAEFCPAYEAKMKQAGGVDIQVLGIGSDGHIAFNEPGSSLSSRTRVVTLTKQTIDDNARFFASADEVPRYAVTMGVGTILEAAKIVLIATGKNKAEAVAGAIEGPITSMNTASALQMHPCTTMILDQDAASLLRMRDYYDWIQKNSASTPQ